MVSKSGTGLQSHPSTAVIEAIAEYEGLDPVELEPPLFEVIDPDALDALVGNEESGQAQSDIAVQFTYNQCRVKVSSDGSIEVSSSQSE